ncbi:MAG: AMP-binding protein [Myxococcota bacterium]
MNATMAELGTPLLPKLTEWSAIWREQHRLDATQMRGRAPHDGTPVLRFETLADLIPYSDDTAITDPIGDRPSITFRELHQFVCVESPIAAAGIRPGFRCAIALPNGPELAVCLLATTMVGIAVPINPERPAPAIAADLEVADVDVIIVRQDEANPTLRDVADRLGLAILELRPAERAGTFELIPGPRWTPPADGSRRNGPTDLALLLMTSGTSGTKKQVPIVLEDLCVGACCIAASLELGPLDMGFNMMPLFHAGGIYRNVFAPLLAGSPMSYAPGFDPDLFWRSVQRWPVTWYYAAPTMHRMILDEASAHPNASKVRLRFVANAAGAMLPQTQRRIQERFGARVLPSYGMTECMPISCPPLDGPFPEGSSGRVLGVEVSIRSESGEELPPGVSGRILLRGAPLMRGYLGPEAANGRPDGWFDTGDLGFLDEHRFVTITGRSKEVINRGGEIISPFEVESALLAHPDVRASLAFVVEHDTLDEVVGAVIVPQGPRPDLRSLHAFLRERLHPSKWPVVVVYMDALPRNHTNKVVRIGLAKRLGLGAIDERSPLTERMFEATCPPPCADRRQPIVVRQAVVAEDFHRPSEAPRDALERELHGLWTELLGSTDFGRTDDFFELGGGSLAAVQLATRLRRSGQRSIESMVVFRHRTIASLAEAIRSLQPTLIPSKPKPKNTVSPTGGRISESWGVRMVQALPFLTFGPLRRIAGWLVFLIVWVSAYQTWDLTRSGSLIAALLVTGGVMGLGAPLLGVLGKWLLIGRVQAGRHPLWGSAYLRWWLVNQWLRFTGLGLFGVSYGLTAAYYRLLGASVGKRTRIMPNADLGEPDLLSIGDDVCIDSDAVVHPFAMDAGEMVFAPISIGARATVGRRAIVPPGTQWPSDGHLAPGASDAKMAGWCRPRTIHPPFALRALANGLVGANHMASWLPFYVFLLLVRPLPSLIGWQDAASWFLVPEKVTVYLLMRVSLALVSPFLYFGGVVALKWLVIGRFRAGADPRQARGVRSQNCDGPWAQFRRYLMWRLLPDGTFGGLGPLLGSNFGAISTLYRLLGAKVGRRIYWPGSGHQLIEYDLFTCGDDVTFGSRTTLLPCDGRIAAAITIEDGATVADRCFLGPGTVVGRNAVLGTGTVTPAGFVAPAGSTWLGFDGQRPIEVEPGRSSLRDAPTIRPFGRVHASGIAPYRVFPEWAYGVVNSTLTACGALIKASLLLLALAIALPLAARFDAGFLGFGLWLLAGFIVVHAGGAALVLIGSIGAKWVLIGRRKPGPHPWDESPYCQRWKLHQAIQRLHQSWIGGRPLLDSFGGSAFMVDYFRALGAQIGRSVCLYPNGADPMATEPDLLTIGDGAVIDRAIIVAHLNTRGQWELGPIAVGREVSLRSDSRVLMWGEVEDCAQLVEHTLVLGGEVVESGQIWSGWPGRPEGRTPNYPSEANRAPNAASGDRPAVSMRIGGTSHGS